MCAMHIVDGSSCAVTMAAVVVVMVVAVTADNQAQRKIILEHALAIIREHRSASYIVANANNRTGNNGHRGTANERRKTSKIHVKWYENKNADERHVQALKK